MVHKERFPATTRPQDELVAIGNHPLLHRQVRNIQMQRSARHPIHHLDTEGRERTLVIRFFREEAQGLRDECVETFLERKIPLVSRYARPKKRRHVHGVIPWLALHKGELAAHVILDVFQFFPVVRPCHHVTVAAYRNQPLAVRFVQVFLYPSLVDLVGTGVTG